jgi:hypothetical protein
MGSKSFIAHAMLGLGLVALAQARESTPTAIDSARQFLSKILTLRRELGDKLEMITSLVGMSAIAMHIGDVRNAVQLAGAVEASLEALKFVMDGDVRPLDTQTLAEHPFGTIKHHMDQGHFLMKGLENVNAEMNLSVLA